MFLFHWCLNAIRCRRDTTLETMPLSPTKYNGLPPALDAHLLQRQLPASGCDVTGVRQSLLLDDFLPGFFHSQESATALNGCDSELRNSSDVAVGSYYHPDDMMALPSTQVITANRSEHCDCECTTATSVSENTGQVAYSCDTSSSSVSPFTDFCISSSQLAQRRLKPEQQHQVETLDKDSSFVSKEDLPHHTQVDVDFLSESHVFGMSHRNAVASLPVDTAQDSLVTVAATLVNYAFNSAVKILKNDFTVTAEPNPTPEVDILTAATASNSVQPSRTAKKSIKDGKDPVEAVASRLVNQVLSAIVQKDSSGCASVCTEALRSETSITTATCLAPSCHATHCQSDGKPTADNDVESGAPGNAAGCELMPAAAGECYLSGSECATVDERQVLVAYELVRVQDDCDCSSLYDESMNSLCGGRLTFVSEMCRPVSPPFSEAYWPDDISETLNNSSVAVGVLNDHRHVVDDPSSYDRRRINNDYAAVSPETMAERGIDLPRDGDADRATINLIDHRAPVDNNCTDVRSSSGPEKLVHETWDSYESSSRPEDYFFHRYVIPVDQLEAGEAAAAHSEREDQRSRMQLDLKMDEASGEADLDADIEAVAAFCRAMFTPVETDTDDTDDRVSAFDDSSPDSEDRRPRPAGVRRCISLRTSPGTPHKKKSVRFADALGLDLEYVRQIQTSIDEPLPPPADDDERRSRRPLLAEASAAWRRSRPLVRRCLCACFQVPGVHPDFVERVHRSRVALESCDSDDRAMTISGVVRVANVAYRKLVAARVTTDGWATQTDVAADYMPRSNDGTTDRFAFHIALPRGATDLGRRVEFAVHFTAFFDGEGRAETYWDNNFGANYCFEYYATAEPDNDDGQLAIWSRFV